MQHTCARRPLAFAIASITTLTSLSALVGTPVVKACGPPPTFSEMLGAADIIVIASIGEIEKKKVKLEEETYEVSIATLHVAESLKGGVSRGQSIRVSNIDESSLDQAINSEEPQPDAAKVPLSMKTGLFLIDGPHQEDADSVSGYSNAGTYDITESAAREGLVPIVREHVAIEAITDVVKQRTSFLEWIVKCTENPTTRRDGFYEFSRADEERMWRLQSETPEDRDNVAAKVAFSDSQIDRIVAIWLEALEKREDGAMWFGDAIGEHRGDLVATKLLEVLTVAGANGPDDAGTWMSTIAGIYEWRSGQLLATKFWETEDPAERSAIVKRFVELAPIRGEIPEALVPENAEDESAEAVEDVETEAVTEMEAVEREAVEAIEQAGIESDPSELNETEVFDGPVELEMLSARPDELNKR